MPRIDKLQKQFPHVDLRFQLISGALRGPVENVDLGMRFRDREEPSSGGTLVMKEVMLPMCSPAYLGETDPAEGNTIIRLAETPGDWAAEAADRSVAGIGALGRREIVQHAVAVIGPEHDLPVGRTPRVLLQQRLQHRDHVDVTVEMIGLVEGQAIRFALGRAQMRKG